VVSARAGTPIDSEDALTPRVFLLELGQAIARDLAGVSALAGQEQPA